MLIAGLLTVLVKRFVRKGVPWEHRPLVSMLGGHLCTVCHDRNLKYTLLKLKFHLLD